MENKGFIPLMVPDIRQQDIDAVVEVLRSGMLVQGRKVEELEKTFAEYIGVRHAIAVSSGTASLHLALIALGIKKGDEVIVPAFSFMATANVVELVGAIPIFVDIEIETFNINTKLIENAISERTKAIIPVHEFGLACNITEICTLAEKHKLIVIEDAACALGAKENNQYTGSFGDVGSFSFHPRKAITSGEGGMLTTNDDELAGKLMALRNHGIEIRNGKTEFVVAGFNYRMTDFQAAMLISQFARLNDILIRKNKLAQEYFRELQSCNSLQLPVVPENKNHTWQSFHIVLDEKFNREQIIVELRKQDVGTNYGAQCIPYQKYFQNKYKLSCKKIFPNALRAYQHGLVLPLYQQLNKYQIKLIEIILRTIINQAHA